MKITKNRYKRQAVFQPRRSGLLQVDLETQTILYARKLVRRHPQIIERLFPGKGVSAEQASKSIHHIGTARETILIADTMGLLGGMV
ncbi:MAG: hypothetical protein KBA61_03415 [Spirochaetes bacterium]|nr:hypothetical protein [Spirochaetota bacterium]